MSDPRHAPLHPPGEDGLGPVPEANQPGHHPEVEQDKPTRRPRPPRTVTPERRNPTEMVFPFRFSRLMQALALPFGVLPATTSVTLTDDDLSVRFGPWSMRTPLSNVTGAQVSGPYSLPKVAGPAHLSFTDRGVTFATNDEAGVCVTFAEPVKALDPTGHLRHPGATITVADPEGFRAALMERVEAAR